MDGSDLPNAGQGCLQTQTLLGSSGRNLSKNMERYVQGHTFQLIFIGKAEQKSIPSAFLTAELLSPSSARLRLTPEAEHLSLEAGEALLGARAARPMSPEKLLLLLPRPGRVVAPGDRAGVTGSLVQEQGWEDPPVLGRKSHIAGAGP